MNLINYHICMIPNVLSEDQYESLEKYIRRECELKGFLLGSLVIDTNDTDEDYPFHLIIAAPTTISPEQIMRILKAEVAVKMYREYSGLMSRYSQGSGLWKDSGISGWE